MQSEAGVTVTAVADAWRGIPPNLATVIPLLVTIENGSGQPLAIRYSDFALGDARQQVTALPPFQIEGTATVGTTGAAAAAYPYTLTDFYVAPHLSPFYPALTPFAGPFVYDPLFYDSYYPRFVRLQLPTGDMVQKALPEGVIQPGGAATGFLYFERIDVGDTNGDSDRGMLRVDLVNASNAKTFGTLHLPVEID